MKSFSEFSNFFGRLRIEVGAVKNGALGSLLGLALKAALLAAAWLILPGWFFLLLSFYFYFVPIFHPWKVFLPFLCFLFLAFNGPVNFGFAVILAVLFYIILGIKDLIFIDRRSAYNNLVLVLIFLLDIWFFSSFFGDSVGRLGIVSIFLLSAISCLLYREFLTYGKSDLSGAGFAGRVNLALGLAWLIISQISLAVIFLPVNFLYQTALIFFLSAAFLGLVSTYLSETISREMILMNFSVVFVFLVIALGSVQWGL